MRKVKFAPQEYYHIYNRGNDKKPIFLDHLDYIRFLFLILFFQAPVPLHNIGRYTASYVKHSVFNIGEETMKKILKERMVELLGFTLMPNHFHLILYERSEHGISQYMQRALDAYTKYFNTRYKKSGHLFQGPFQAVYVETDVQLLYLSAYIHRNSRELRRWQNREHLYPWSSYSDYVVKNRWGDLLNLRRILEQFSNQKEYYEFVKKSPAKGGF